MSSEHTRSTSPPARGYDPGHQYSRRPHKKSKTGCAECKRRRVKCSESRPRCHACRRNDTPCNYPVSTPPPPPLTQPDETPRCASGASDSVTSRLSQVECLPSHEGQSPSVSSLASGAWTANPPVFTIDDLGLIHHWTYSTSLAMIRCAEYDRYWQVIFPQVGLRHPFVMHGILALAALHLASSTPDQRGHLSMVSIQHHNNALRGYQEGIKHMSEKNCDALFVFASLNFVYVLAKHGPIWAHLGANDDLQDRRSQILGHEWMAMLRGVGAVLGPVYDHVRFGPLRALVNLGNFETLDPDRDKAPNDEQFCRLAEIWAGTSDADTYDTALYMLRKCCAFLHQFDASDNDSMPSESYNRAYSAPSIWLHCTPEAYFVRLQQRQPTALIIYAYYGTLLHALDNLWFLRGWGRSIVEQVDELLGSYWNTWMQWPKSIVRPATTPPAEVAQSRSH